MAIFSIAALLTPGTATGNYDITQAWVPLPPGITSLPAAPSPVPDATYGEVLTPTALLRPYQEKIRVDCVVKVQMTQRRLEYPLVLPTREDTMRIRTIGAPTLHLGDFDSALVPKVTATLADRQVFRSVSMVVRVQFAPGAAWTPLDLSPTVWLDASDAATVTLDSGVVSVFEDKSGNGNDFSQPTAASRPSYPSNQQNGLSVIAFNGTDESLQSDTLTSALLGWNNTQTDWTIITVAKPIATSTSFGTGTFDSANEPIWRINSSRPALTMSSASSGTVILRHQTSESDHLNAAWPLGTWKIATVSATPINLKLNDDTTLTDSAAQAYAGSFTFYFGGLSGFGFLEMQLGECIMVDRALTEGELDSAIAYLAAKWGITI